GPCIITSPARGREAATSCPAICCPLSLRLHSLHMAQPEDTAPAQSVWAWDARRIGLLGVLTFARFLQNTLLRIVYPFAPAFARGLGVPIETIYLIISLRNLMSLLSPFLASLPERFGRRNVMSAVLLVFSAVCLLVVGVPVIWTLA